MEGFLLQMVRWIHSPRHQDNERQVITDGFDSNDSVDSASQQTWADLLSPLLELILERLPITDYLRFAAVCRFWRDVQCDHRRHHSTSPRQKKQMPWLMLPQDPQFPKKLVFYNPSEQRYYELFFCKLQTELYICGCSNGWLLLLNTCNTLLFLVNPFTGSEIQITIPPYMITHPNYRPLGILSSVPADPGCLVLLWDDTNASRFSCCISEKTWSEHPGTASTLGHFTYDVFCGGSFYLVIGLSLQDPLLILDDRRLPVAMSQWPFIMESDGKMLSTVITWTDDRRVKRLYVWEWDPLNSNWVLLKNLGDRVLFLCRWQCLSMSATDAGGPGNRICLTWRMNFFDQEEQQNQMWIEYDYGSHQVMNKKLFLSKDPAKEGLSDEHLCWFAPSLM